MATKDSESIVANRSRDEPVWACALLGVVLIASGMLVLGDLALATVVTTVAIASGAILGGGFEIAHAIWTKGWGAFGWQILLGALYIAFGTTLISRPEFSAVVLTFALGLILLASGLVRILLGFLYGKLAGSLLLLSGIVGVIAGAAILTRWPVTGLWAIGLALGVDLISHGLGWLAIAWRKAVMTRPGGAGGADEAIPGTTTRPGTTASVSEQP